MLTRNGTDGRVYGGDKNLVHIADGKRGLAGDMIASFVDSTMKTKALMDGNALAFGQNLCPGCYMIALYNAAVTLAEQNGQPLTELGHTMAQAFAALADNPSNPRTEEIAVILDND